MLIRKGTAVIAGASSAIGVAYADRLASQGYDLILIDQQRDALHQAATLLTDKNRRAVEVLAADLAMPDDLIRVQRALRQDASITLLVNAASNAAAAGLANTVAPGFAARGIGTLINVASMPVSASRVLSLCQTLRQQFTHHGIQIQAVLVFMDNDLSPTDWVDAALSGLASGEHITLLMRPSRTLH